MAYDYQRVRFFDDQTWSFELQLEEMAAIAGVLLLIALLYFASTALEKWRARKRVFRSPFAISAPRDIDFILTEAETQRSKISLSLSRGLSRRRPFNCSLLEVRAEELVVETADLTGASDRLAGKAVSGFFRLATRDRKIPMAFYTFDSIIRHIEHAPLDLTRLVLERPTVVTLSQRRSQMRLEPPHASILTLALWPYADSTVRGAETDTAVLGPPLFRLTPEPSVVRILNISGGGLRLHLTPATKAARSEPLDPGRRLVVRLDLADLGTPDAPLRLWLLGEIRNVFADPATRTVDIGMQFIAVGLPSEDPARPGLVQWERVGDLGVITLGNWVVKRHLELYRDKGIVGA